MESIDWSMVLDIIAGLMFIYFFVFVTRKPKKRKSRRNKDKPIENHKFKFRPPTWRFQKYHPDRCPHDNGIYREVEIRVLEDTVKKRIFVCADCVSTIEIDELDNI